MAANKFKIKYGSSSNRILLSVALAFLYVACAHANESFNATKDATSLKEALLVQDDAAVIQLLSCRSSEERSQIAAAYDTRRSLVNDIRNKLLGDFEDLVMVLMTPLQEFYAKTLKAESETLYCCREILLDILVISSNAELKAFKDGNPNLVNQLAANCRGAVNATIHDLFNGARNETQAVDEGAALADAQLLYQIFEDGSRPPSKWDNDQFLIEGIFVTRSYSQLRKIFKMYERSDVAGRSIESAILDYKFRYRQLKIAVYAIYNAIRSKPYYFADRLYDAMRSLGTDEEALNRIFVGRSGIDLNWIEKAYNNRRYGSTLTSRIRSETSFSYQDLLIAMLECNRK